MGTLVASLILAGIFTLLIVTIFLNIVDRDRVLPNIYLENDYVGLMEIGDVKVQYEKAAIEDLPSKIKLTIGTETKEYKTSELAPELYLDRIKDVGRDSDPIRALEEMVSVANPIKFSYEYKFDVNKIISEFKLFNDDEFKFVEDDGRIVGCSSNGLSAKLVDVQKVNDEITENLAIDTEVKLDKSQILSEGTAKDVYLICNRFKYDANAMTAKFQRFGDIKSEDVLSFMGMYLSEEGSLSWKIYNKENLKKFLNNLKTKTEVALDEGEYEDINGVIRLFRKYVEGKALDIDSSLSNLVRWSADPISKDFKLVFKTTSPWYIKDGRQIEDFTYELSRGESRINLYVGGWDNPSLYASRVGVDEMDGYVLNPGEEYSFFNFLQPQLSDMWRTKEGNPILSGICNSSTTIFRAALHAGFPITERWNHGWSLEKYRWPYSENVVDATYLTTPKIDLRFVNDIGHPVVFKLDTWRDAEWEYQRLRVMTSPKAKGRTVELANFRKWGERLPGIYKGSFDRIIKQDGAVVGQDYFESNYHMYAPY